MYTPKQIRFQNFPLLIEQSLEYLLALASITVYHQHIDNDVHALDTSVHTLTPSKTSETFEMGLYESSQKEEYNQYYGYRETKKNIQVGLFEHFII